MQCKGDTALPFPPILLCGETGNWVLDALDPIEARDGVEAEVEADCIDMGREDMRDPGEETVGYSTGRSSTSIESIKSRLLLKRFAWMSGFGNEDWGSRRR